jgi:hypothetical protein
MHLLKKKKNNNNQERDWPMRTIKNFAGKNTKTSGIKLRFVLRASAIGKYKLTMLLNTLSAFDLYTRRTRASIISGIVRGCAKPRLAGATRGITIGLLTND